MGYQDCKKLFRTAFVAAALCASASVQASFTVAIDEFTITRNGNPFFRDSFSDGVAPPSAPNFIGGGPTSYSVFGSSQTETGGKYTMDSTLGGYTLAGDGTARLRNINTLLTNNNPADPNTGLKPNHTFVVGGLFDLVATPAARDTYGISLKDTTGPAVGSATAGQAWSLAVGRIGSGLLGIHLIMQDYTAHTISVLSSAPLDFSHDQILLQFDRNSTGSDLAHASYQYWDGGSANGGFTAIGDATLFQSQQWVRADFFTNQQTPVVPVPEPATGLLVLAGLGLVRIARRGAPHGKQLAVPA